MESYTKHSVKVRGGIKIVGNKQKETKNKGDE